ncbi:MAG: galactose mutarotase [Alphaproteobacteria bacterium]|nr:galactose mutarotase [Alphaproteobacteria bacterium]
MTNRAERSSCGTMPDGTAVEAVTLANSRGLAATVITYGATLTRLLVPDRNRNSGNVVLGFDTLEATRKARGCFGSTVGRYANRIAGARFALDGVSYNLVANERGNTLHGGVGFDKALWTIEDVAAGDQPTVRLSHVSPDGDQGFPGRLAVSVSYAMENDGLRIDYRATTDKPTVLNLTNHSYFNLAAGETEDVLGHELTIAAERFTPVDASLIPTGELRPVAGTPFDFRGPQPIGARIGAADPQLEIGRGYDHNFVLRGAKAAPVFAARARDPGSGRVLEVWTTEPGVQLYTGNFLDGSLVGADGRRFGRHAGFCLETQHFPDSPNRPEFPSTVLRPSQTFTSTTVFRFPAG